MSDLLHRWFAEPWLLWLLLALPALTLLSFWARRQRRRALAMFGGIAWSSLARRRRVSWPALAMLLGMILVAVGAAGPQWGREWGQTTARGRDLVIVMDMSRSMLAESPKRFERARAAVLDLSRAVQKRGGHRLGLVVFAGRARLACPLTPDYDLFRHTVENLDAVHLDPAVRGTEDDLSGTRIGEGLRIALLAHDKEAEGVQDLLLLLSGTHIGEVLRVALLAHEKEAKSVRDLLLLSDGDDPDDESEEWRFGILAVQPSKIPVHVVGIGDAIKAHKVPPLIDSKDEQPEMSKYQEKVLRAIADETDGTYTAMGTEEYPLGELYLSLIAGRREREHGVDSLPVYKQRAVWFLLPALALLTMSLLLGEGRRLF